MAHVFTILICACIALFVNLNGYINPDSAWLITAAERWLTGERLYVDVVETNPPLVVYLTALPLLAGFEPVRSFVVFTVVLSALFAMISIAQAENKALRYWLIFALMLLPANNLGQREHFFLLFTTPYFLQLMQGKRLSVPLAAFAAAGIALKPYFIVFWLAAVLASRARLFDATNILIGALLAGYTAYVIFFVPEYIALVGPMLKYYGSFALPVADVLRDIAMGCVFYLLPLAVLRVKFREALNRQLYVAGALFVAALLSYIVQFKGWTNHMLPVHFYGGLLTVLIAHAMVPFRRELWGRAVLAIGGIVMLMQLGLATIGNVRIATRYGSEHTDALVQALNTYADGGSVYALTFDLPDLYPALNYSRAHSVSRYAHLWMLPGLYKEKQLKGEQVQFYTADARSAEETAFMAHMAEDIVRNKPKLLLVADKKYIDQGGGFYRFDYIAYLTQIPELAKLFKQYREKEKVGDLRVFVYTAPSS